MEPPKSPLRKRILYKLFEWCGLTTLEIDRTLWRQYRKGVEVGRNQHQPPIYGPCCPIHGTEHFVCIKCQPMMPQVPFPDPHTDKMEHVIPAMRYIQQQREPIALKDTTSTGAIPKQVRQR